MASKLSSASVLLLALLSPCRAAEPRYAGKPLAFWLEELKSDDPLIREEAILVLTDAGPAARSATARLEALLKDEQRGVRIRAALALWRIAGQTAPALSELTEALHDPALGNRAEMLSKLGELGSAAADSAAVVVPYLDDADAQVRTQAMQAMQRFGAAAAPSILILAHDKDAQLRAASLKALQYVSADPKLARKAAQDGLEDDDPLVRVRAANLLWRAAPKHPDVLPHVLELLKQPVGRTELLQLLSQIGSRAARAVPTLTELLADADPMTRRLSIQALGRLGPAARPTVPKLLEQLDKGDLSIRQAAANALRSLGGDSERIVPAVLEIVKNDRNNIYMCLPLLADQGAKAAAAAPWLVAEVQRPPPSYATLQMVETLHAIDPARARKEAVPIVRKMLAPKGQWPVYAARVLWRLQPGSDEALKTLIVCVEGNNVNHRQTACLFLGTLGKSARAAVPALRKVLNDAAMSNRVEAAAALWKISGETETTAPVLLEALKSSASNFTYWRHRAALALGEMGPAVKTNVLPELRKFRDDPEPAVRSAVLQAIQQIEGPAEKSKTPSGN